MIDRGARIALACALVACGDSGTETDPPPEGSIVVHVSDFVDANGEGSLTLDDVGDREIEIFLDDAPRLLELDAHASAATLEDAGGEVYDGGVWFRPRPVDADQLVLKSEGATSVTIFVRGAPVPAALRERSLVWIDPAIVDDPTVIDLARVLEAAAPDGDGGAFIDAWFRRFATTLHSERAGPAQLMDELAGTLGSDPSEWDLAALPFKLTAVHNRLDLGARNGDCGELRVSFGSTHAIYAPLHILFLFKQMPVDGDIAPTGEVHCLATGRRWARLSAMDGEAFVAAASALLDDSIRQDHFALAESVELTVSPWEWRQWRPENGALENPALFQTVATDALNQPGPLRDEFLAFVSDNAPALAARELLIPASFRGASIRVAPSVPREELDLTGLDPALLQASPDLAHSIEIVGCAACHTEDANFVQTNLDRTFSPFYDRELDARAERLDALNRGEVPALLPFGPLQPLD